MLKKVQMTTPKPRYQLLLVKNLYSEGEQAASRENNFSISKSLLFLDLAVEQMLLTILTAINTQLPIPKGELKWDQLWQSASDIMTEQGHTLPGKAALRNLHQDRNRVQHGGYVSLHPGAQVFGSGSAHDFYRLQ
jgi:hypothetical protein